MLFIRGLIKWILGFPGGSDSKESACKLGDLGLVPGSGGTPGEGHGNPFQYSGGNDHRNILLDIKNKMQNNIY